MKIIRGEAARERATLFIRQKYEKTLGIEILSVIEQDLNMLTLLTSLNDRQSEVLVKCINQYQISTGNEEWTQTFCAMLDNITSGEYTELISSIDDFEKIDIEKLAALLQHPNQFNIKTVEELNRIEEIKRQQCDKIIETSQDIEQIRLAVVQKNFGQSLSAVRSIVSKYGEDIEHIEDCDEKAYVMCLIELLKIEDINILKDIYSQTQEIEGMDRFAIERKLKNAYFKDYNDSLYKVDEKHKVKGNKINDENPLEEELMGLDVYFAGTDFAMMITSIAPISKILEKIENYEEDWNRKENTVPHFCASYIRNDMLGTIDIPHICYGFTNFEEDALLLSGPTDIASPMYSSTVIKAESSRGELDKYYTPDTQINKTEFYNEMDIKRYHNGNKRQPSYIVAFRTEGKIPNIHEIVRAYKEWGGKIPIVVVDVDMCLESEKRKVEHMVKEYRLNPTGEQELQILQKIRNNSNSKRERDFFCKDIKNDLIQNKTKREQEKKLKKEIERKYGKTKEELEETFGIEISYEMYIYQIDRLIVKTTLEMQQQGIQIDEEVYDIYNNSLLVVADVIAESYSNRRARRHAHQHENDLEEIGIDLKEFERTIEEFKINDGMSSSKESLREKIIGYILTKCSIDREKVIPKKQYKTPQIQKEDLRKMYEHTSAKERDECINKIKHLLCRINSRVMVAEKN